MNENTYEKRFSEACERNKDPILAVLKEIFPKQGLVLEIASGTGQHAIHFASNLPDITWQPSDMDPELRSSVHAWRTEFNLELEDLTADLYSNFTHSIKSPSCVTMFKLQELNGVCLLDVNSHLSATVVDRILGGRGSTNPEERGLTDIEKALVEDFNQIILEEWSKQWHQTMVLNPSIIGTESTGKFLQTSPSDAMMLILSMEVEEHWLHQS